MAVVFTETFETVGYDNTWSEVSNGPAGSLVDSDYATSNISSPDGWEDTCARYYREPTSGQEHEYSRHNPSSADPHGYYYKWEIVTGAIIPAGNTEFMRLGAASAFSCQPHVGTDATIFRVDGATGGDFPAAAVTTFAANTRYNVEFYTNYTGNAWEIRIDEETLASGTYSSEPSAVDAYFIGMLNCEDGTFSVYHDNMVVDSETWPGSSASSGGGNGASSTGGGGAGGRARNQGRGVGRGRGRGRGVGGGRGSGTAGTAPGDGRGYFSGRWW